MSKPDLLSVELSELPGTGSFLQSAFWGRLKEAFGWFPITFIFQGMPLLVLVRKIFGKYSIAYIPHGPILQDTRQNGAALEDLGCELKKYLPAGSVCLRFDLPGGIIQKDPVSFNLGPNLIKAYSDIQPPDTVLVSLIESENTIMARMKSKTRYNIRLSFRKGVTVYKGGSDLLDQWYSLYEETASRDRIAIHSRDYYRKIFELSEADAAEGGDPSIVLFKAVYNDRMIAGIIVSFYGDTATYLYGASSDEERNRMPAYALQWEAMKYAKERGCSVYDLFGIPPADDPEHPMSGLYMFKTGFGGEILHRPGCWDLPLKPRVYTLYRWAEYLRLFYFKKLRKR